MALFNGLQMVLLFAAGPFLITYVKDASFYAHTPLFWVLVVGYLIGFGGLTVLVAENLHK
jgi:hypothetical protein